MDYMPTAMSEDDLLGQVSEDAPCRKCSYNLRGLPKEGRCPECGTAIGISICGDLLRFSHPRWLQRVADGLMLILWGILVSIVVAFIAGLVMKNEPAVRQIIVALGSLVGVIGTWQMTTPDPSGVGEAPGLTSRKLVRAAVFAGVAANLLQVLVAARVFSPAVALFGAACGLVGIVGEFAKLHYIGLLAARLPDNALRGRANSLKWAMAICYALILVVGVVMAIMLFSAIAPPAAAGGRPAMGGIMAAGCLMLPLALAMLVLAIMALLLIYRTSTAIRGQIPVAIGLWQHRPKKRESNP